MNENIIFEHTVCGIYCDNENCNYCDETVELKELPQWLNKPCPLCGENLLTEEDYQNSLKIDAAVDIINNLSESEMLELDAIVKESGLDIKKSDVFKDAKGLEHLDNNQEGAFEMLIDSHKEIKVTEIKLIPNEN